MEVQESHWGRLGEQRGGVIINLGLFCESIKIN